jgi:hypothetical protein
MKAIRSSERSVLTTGTRRHIPEDGILLIISADHPPFRRVSPLTKFSILMLKCYLYPFCKQFRLTDAAQTCAVTGVEGTPGCIHSSSYIHNNNDNNKFNLNLFTCQLNSTEANYKVGTRRDAKHNQKRLTKHDSIHNEN